MHLQKLDSFGGTYHIRGFYFMCTKLVIEVISSSVKSQNLCKMVKILCKPHHLIRLVALIQRRYKCLNTYQDCDANYFQVD